MDVMERALEDYRDKYHHAFKHVGAWRVVKDRDKWTKVPLLNEKSGSSSNKRKSSDSANFGGASEDCRTTDKSVLARSNTTE